MTYALKEYASFFIRVFGRMLKIREGVRVMNITVQRKTLQKESTDDG